MSDDSGRPSTHLDVRPDSPAASSFVSHATSRANSQFASADPANPNTKGNGRTSLEAHRARELRWISAMSSTPEAQARKSKKIRKLVIEGVPASVRYLVWAHLADAKGRRIPGVYTQLGKRARIAIAEEIERDARDCFPDHPHLREEKGALVTMLQAYMTMVPDVEYQTSLVIIAGHLLLQSPEEDAFWTFLAIMDTHLRSYFSPRTVQMEVDASIFSKAVEAVDASLAKRLFVDLDLSAVKICRPWFSSLFSNILPSDFVNRIWDVFLYDGPPFLFRVGLAILSCCRTRLLDASSNPALIYALLAFPPTSLLPEDPEALITLALSMKFKDDDVRRQRVKLEAQLKRQTQQTNPRSAFSAISLPRS
ncbi:RabGAP/TBC [Rickenella mellea]|uniref:RabGAP/TBC n=1 Tax=Rickenella mellea TaxID=50990 RepID=A0A4Y7Q0S2_9AGAM|nr:RabGAP/TBC [Rickenella mellea]